MNSASPGPLVILIHGAWAGSWVWNGIAPALEAVGYRVIAVDLPGTPLSERPESEADLNGYVAEVGRWITADDTEVHLVGHSGGGVVATAAAEAFAPQIASVSYVAGIMLPSGIDFGTICAELGPAADGIVPYLRPIPGGTIVPPETAAAVFFQRSAAAEAVDAARRLVPQPDSGLAMTPVFSSERYGRIPRLYVEARHDRSIPLVVQRHLQTLTPGAEVVTLDSDHAPQLSAPADLTAALITFIDKTVAAASTAL